MDNIIKKEIYYYKEKYYIVKIIFTKNKKKIKKY